MVERRGCKASSKNYPNYFNVRKEAEDAEGIDLDEAEWKFKEQKTTEKEQKKEEVNAAVKEREGK